MTIAQAKAARRQARQDPRYPQNKKDAAARQAKLQKKIEAEQARRARSKKKGK